MNNYDTRCRFTDIDLLFWSREVEGYQVFHLTPVCLMIQCHVIRQAGYVVGKLDRDAVVVGDEISVLGGKA